MLFENGGYPGHIYRGFPRDSGGYSNNVLVAQNYLAVTGACLMTRREVFDRVGGLSTTFPVNYNDMDYCLKVGAEGLRVVYDPDTVLYHFESSSRNSDVAEWEVDALLNRWLGATIVDPHTSRYLRHGAPRISGAGAWMPRRLPRRRRSPTGG